MGLMRIYGAAADADVINPSTDAKRENRDDEVYLLTC